MLSTLADCVSAASDVLIQLYVHVGLIVNWLVTSVFVYVSHTYCHCLSHTVSVEQ